MNINLYNCNCENIRVYKVDYLDTIITLEGYLRETSSVVNPIILIELNPKNLEKYIDTFVIDNNDDYVTKDSYEKIMVTLQQEIVTCNYVYIPDFNRHYFVNDITIVRNNLYRLSLHVDVLMSYKNEISNVNALVSRNEFDYDPDIYDRELPTKQDVSVEFETIENDLISDGSSTDLYQYVVTTITS